jgi:polysaccharide export outer membrane protein
VYVIGHVLKAGPYMVGEQDQMTVLQAVSMAGGMDKLAQPKNARILRRVPGKPERTEIAVNLADVLAGKTSDFAMQPEDILYVPNNVPKSALLRTLDVAIQMGTGVVIWNRY